MHPQAQRAAPAARQGRGGARGALRARRAWLLSCNAALAISDVRSSTNA